MHAAIMRASSADDDSHDYAFASGLAALLASQLISVMILVERAFLAIDITVIRSRISAEIQPATQSRLDGRE